MKPITVITPYNTQDVQRSGVAEVPALVQVAGVVVGRLQVQGTHWEAFKEAMSPVADFTQGFN